MSLMTKDIDTIATYIPISHPGTFMVCALTEKAELSMRACATELASWVKETSANVAVADSPICATLRRGREWGIQLGMGDRRHRLPTLEFTT